MSKDREYPHPVQTGMRVMVHVGLAGVMVIATSSGWQGSAAPNQPNDLPKVEAGTGSPLPAPAPADSEASPSGTPASRTAPSSTPVTNDSGSAKESGQWTATKSSSSSKSSTSPRFFCQVWGGQHTVMYSPENRTTEAFPWAVPKDLGGGWYAERRCGEISRRLEEYRPDGLQELSTSTENGYNIVCATTQANPACRIVFTVPRGQDPVTTRNSVFENLTVADSGKMTQGVNTFVGNNNGNLNLTDDLVNLGLSVLGGGSSLSGGGGASAQGDINLKPFLAPSDGGTGVGLKNGVRLQQGMRLDPDKFR